MKTQRMLLRLWHAWLAGGFVVAYATADEDTYALHLFSGYAVLAALALRLIIGLLVTAPSPWRLPDPRHTLRKPIFAWMAAALLAAAGLAAVTGVLADGVTWLEDPHEAVAEASLWVVLGHVAYIAWSRRGRKLLSRALASLVLLVPAMGMADGARDALVAGYAAQAGAAPSAKRGEELFRTRWAGGDARTPSCTACHTDNPRNPGQNAKTGRPIDPVAVSVNPKRFTDRDQVEKQFTRDCRSVLGRECNPGEKADYITFMAGQ